ncbi:putative inorganic phosphate cotransporter [Halotydeus destructor]|nr:putative inorganic phosphate cotransporter [Halotydeus destructor]
MLFRTKQRTVASLCFLAAFIELFCRNNLNLAIVAMVLPQDMAEVDGTNVTRQCSYEEADVLGHDELAPGPKFDWTPSMQGVILGAYSYGFLLSQTPAGRWSEKMGGKYVCATGLSISGLVNFITPLIAYNYFIMVASRVVLGVGQGLVYPACYTLLVLWFPRDQAVALFPIMSASGNVGNLAAYLFTGLLCSQDKFLHGWPSSFVITGSLVLVWLLLWFWLIDDRPKKVEICETVPKVVEAENSPLITSVPSSPVIFHGSQEFSASARLRRASGDNVRKSPPFPWKSVIMSGPVWSITFSKISLTCASSVILTQLPTFLQNELDLAVSSNGMLNALAFFFEIVTIGSSGFIANSLIRNRILSRTACRRLFQSISNFGCAACLIAVTFVDCNRIYILLLYFTATFCYGFYAAGEVAVVGEITVHFPATIYSFCNILANVCDIFVPWICGVILEADPYNARHQWNIIFYSAAAILVAGGMLFNALVSTERQPWDIIDE